jgi:hypothetical protein
MYRVAVIAFLALSLLGSPALAFAAKALVEVESPRILVDRGGNTGFKQVVGITKAKPGDLVMATAETGHGFILYPDCDVEVLPGHVYTVENRPGEINEPRRERRLCKVAGFPWWGAVVLVGGTLGSCAADNCFHGHEEGRPASP